MLIPLFISTQTTATAQQAGLIGGRVITVYVDSTHGSDDIAAGTTTIAAYNPDGPGSFYPCPSGSPGHRPNDIIAPNQGNAVLLHAPHPFETITAAVRYIANTQASGQPLPYASATTQFTWDYAIIQLMPGVYGEPGALDPLQNGHNLNGEIFPIRLPPNVSIQGTSALNTILYFKRAKPNGPSFFEFGVWVDPVTWAKTASTTPGAVPINGKNCFISNLTLMGAHSLYKKGGAAVFVDNEVNSCPEISNCFIVRNTVGILANASADGSVTHDIRLTGNTIAFNMIGVWNGQVSRVTGSRGLSRVNMINNIIDATAPWTDHPCNMKLSGWPSPPGWQQFASISSMEGIAAVDLEVMVGSVSEDFNAYEITPPKFDQQQSLPTLILQWLPLTSQRFDVAGPILAGPGGGIDISPITGWKGAGSAFQFPRGILYVRDLLCSGTGSSSGSPLPALNQFEPNNQKFDRSPLDFRLSPNVALAVNGELSPPTMLNPLVDVGMSTLPITMANGRVYNKAPGTLVLQNQNLWAFDNWKFDAEGYGNLRDWDHPAFDPAMYPHPFARTARTTDIGADELAAVLCIGMRQGTTTYWSREKAGYPGVLDRDNKYLWFLGPTSQTAFSPPVTPPYYRIYSASSYNITHWSDLTYQAFPGWGTDKDFTSPVQPSIGTLESSYPAGASATTPHLLPDIHPWWVTYGSTTAPALNLWQSCLNPNYNMSLYIDPLTNVANPPGSGFGFSTTQWLDGNPSGGNPLQGAAFNIWEATDNHILSFDAWGRAVEAGMINNPDRSHILPSTRGSSSTTEALTQRFTIEEPELSGMFGSPIKNIQTFRVRVDEPVSSGN